MRRRLSGSIVRLAVGSAFALLLIVVLTLSVRHYREPQAAPPEALAYIAAKNHEAAVIAAAHQRAESAAATNATEDLAEAERRGGAAANASLARFPNNDNRSEAAGQRD